MKKEIIVENLEEIEKIYEYESKNGFEDLTKSEELVVRLLLAILLK